MTGLNKEKLKEKIGRSDREMLDILIGPKCMNNCIFCTEGGRKTKRKVLSLKEMKELLKDNPNVEQVIFSGGEPTLNKNIVDYIKLAKKYKFPKIVLITNGQKLAEKNFCQKILCAGINDIRISIHGHTSQLHDKQTGKIGSFDKLMKGIKNLERLKKDFDFSLVTITVINKINYSFLKDIIHQLKQVNLDLANFHIVEPTNDGYNKAYKNFDIVMPNYTKVAKSIQKMLDYKKTSKISFDVIIDSIPFCLMQGYEDFMGQRDIHIGFDPINSKLTRVKISDYHGKVKGVSCRKCSYFPYCEGVWEEYVNKKGWKEFQPIISVKD